ncbi:MAG: rhombosortase [Halothiobacillaceae bacterium]
MRPVWIVTASVAILALLVAFMDWATWMRYDRGDILANWQLWRLLTAHLAHVGWVHLAANLAGLLVWTALAGSMETARSLVVGLVVTALAVTLGLLVLNPGVGWYVGLSGVLHGLFAMTAMRLLFRREWLAGCSLVAALGFKLLWEQQHGALGTERLIGAPVLVDAHLYGVIAGAACALILALFWGRR